MELPAETLMVCHLVPSHYATFASLLVPFSLFLWLQQVSLVGPVQMDGKDVVSSAGES